MKFSTICKLALALGSLVFAGCQKKAGSEVPPEKNGPGEQDQPTEEYQPPSDDVSGKAYSESELAGSIAGESWKLTYATFSIRVSAPNIIQLTFYSDENLEDPCFPPFAIKNHISLSVPKKVGELKFNQPDDGTTYTMSFIEVKGMTPSNFITDAGKIQISTLEEDEVSGSLMGVFEAGTTEVNGTFKAKFCK
jgi:hypothetical protein